MIRSESGFNKAIVIGGSISGLLAARVLSDFYGEVTVVERDNLLREGLNRRGVPQSAHAHGLLTSGSEALEELFPGILNELIDAGALEADVANNGRWFFEGECLRRTPSETSGILLSRPLLESWIRQRIRAIRQITIKENCAVRELVSDGRCITGIRTENQMLDADLVVDASGRGSQAPKWLASIGFPVPREEKVGVHLKYTTRFFRRRETDLDGDLFTVIPYSFDNRRSGVILAQEGDRWIVTLNGLHGQQAPEDLEGFIEYARNLPAPYIYDVVRNAEPIGNALGMRFPASVRRRYEELNRFPKGFLVFGDAVCSFNPVYGQGMSVAALQARALREQLTKGNKNIAERFFRAASKLIDTPWSIAVGGDLKMPETVGKRTISGRFMTWYVSKLHRFAHNDANAAVKFLRVAQLLDRPSTLLHPKFASKVLMANLMNNFWIAGKYRQQRPTISEID